MIAFTEPRFAELRRVRGRNEKGVEEAKGKEVGEHTIEIRNGKSES